MNTPSRSANARPNPPANDQAPGIPGAIRDVALHEQLYRYAEDLQQMIERHGVLESRHDALRETCDRLTESRELLDGLMRHSHDIHIITDPAGTILHCNPAVGVIAPAQRLAGYNLRDWVAPDQHDEFQALLALVIDRDGSTDEIELRMRRLPPDTAPLIVAAQVLGMKKSGEIHSLHWVLRDITPLREIQFESQISTMVFESAAEGVMITNLAGDILAVNPAFTRITGYRAEEVLGRKPSLLKSGIQDASFYGYFWHSLRENGSWQGEIYNRKKNGEVYPEWLTISAARDADGQVLNYVAVFSDLSKLLQAEKRLAYLAHHDTLTGLPNRLLFQDRLAQTLTQSRRSGAPFTLIFIDLDRFKPINDSLGHEAGDEVLKVTASRLAAAIREGDTVARLGGDEFVILAPSLSSDDAIGRVCAKALDALSQPLKIEGQELFIGASLGCAEYPRHGDDEVTLLKHADMAMYRAKASGGNTYSTYVEGASSGGDVAGLRLETELRRALERNQLRLEYQPQISSKDGRVLGVEALLRWDHPQLGAIAPNDFIPVAEGIGVIGAIGAWVMETACKQLKAWDASGLPPLLMAVNVSPRQLRDPGFIEVVRGAIAVSGIAPVRLELELTEGEVMAHFRGEISKLDDLRELGVSIAIDDFGTGYSSLARLLHMPIDRLKIDRSFIAPIDGGDSSHAEAICAAILSMGRALGLDLVAEGVENEVQLAALTQQGYHVIQGYLTGRPMTPEALAQWATNRATQVKT